MCMFCAAIPVAGAVGAKINAKQNAEICAAEENGEEAPERKPIAAATTGIIVLLAVGSLLYHAHFYPLI